MIRRRTRFRQPDDRGLHAGVFARVRGFGLESEVPVFVVGLPRSGTTLVEQILASHSQVLGAGEIQLAAETMAALGREEADRIDGLRQMDRPTACRLAAWHLGRLRASNLAAARIVNKMPDNYLYLGLLASLFPRAKFIHCRRDLRDVAVSCWITHFQEVRWANDQRHIASRFQQYQRMMEHWRKVLPAPFGSGLQGDGGRFGMRGPQARGMLWLGLGACLSGILRDQAAGQNGQRRAGPAADLSDLGRPLEALRTDPRPRCSPNFAS